MFSMREPALAKLALLSRKNKILEDYDSAKLPSKRRRVCSATLASIRVGWHKLIKQYKTREKCSMTISM
jgi:hypothetical protein